MSGSEIAIDRKRPLEFGNSLARPDWCKCGRSPDTRAPAPFRARSTTLERQGPPPPPGELPGRRSCATRANALSVRAAPTIASTLFGSRARARSNSLRASEEPAIRSEPPVVRCSSPENRGPSSPGLGARSARRASAMMSWALRAFARRATIRSACRRGRRAFCRTAPPRDDCPSRRRSVDIDPHAIGRALNAAFEDVADVQLAPDLLQVERLALVGESRVRATTASRIRERSVVRLSSTPSTKWSCFGSPPILENGRTTIQAGARIRQGGVRVSPARARRPRANRRGSARRCS